MPGKYDATDVPPSGGEDMQPIPAGAYDVEILSADEGVTRNNDPKVTVNVKVLDGKYKGREIRFHTVTFLPPGSAGAGMSIHFLKCIGEPYEGDFDWNEFRWVGRRFRANVIIGQPDNNGRTWNRIESVLETPDHLKQHNAEKAASWNPAEELHF